MKQLGIKFSEFLASLPTPGLFEYFRDQIIMMDLSTEDFDSDMEPVLGGYYYLVESVNDLKHIGTYNGSLFETSGIFDICCLIDDSEYLQIANMTNNSGGNTYLIPKKFFTDHVLKSIEVSVEDN